MNLDQLFVEYNKIQEQEKEIKNQKDSLKADILKALEEKQLLEYVSTDGTLKGSIVNKETIKYEDEFAIIKYLKENNLNKFVKETIDTTNFNKELKSSKLLQESLSGTFISTTVPALTIKKI